MRKLLTSDSSTGNGQSSFNNLFRVTPNIYRVFFVALFLFLTSPDLFSQQIPDDQQEFMNKLTERSGKIVNGLSLDDSAVAKELVSVIAKQYYDLNNVHDNSKNRVKGLKAENLSKEETDQLIKQEEGKKEAALKSLHTAFIEKLAHIINATQVEKIKDGMTYNIMNVTYGAYQDMIPSLTDAQKQKIYNWLKEARELAMDEGSSEDKHKVFGKYKGRINNYLSAEGYDMKKEEKDWQERIKAKKAQQ